MSQALYRFYTDTGRLLYVGITADPGKRFGQHAATKSWWPDVRGISLEWYETRVEVEHAERRAIQIEQPVWNTQRAAMRPPPPTRRCKYCPAVYEDFELDEDEEPQEACGMCDAIIMDAYSAGFANGRRIPWEGFVHERDVRRKRGDYDSVVQSR